jgi:hypothetical protein
MCIKFSFILSVFCAWIKYLALPEHTIKKRREYVCIAIKNFPTKRFFAFHRESIKLHNSTNVGELIKFKHIDISVRVNMPQSEIVLRKKEI